MKVGGPLKTSMTGEATAIDGAVAGKPGTINNNPYGRAAKIKPANRDAAAAILKTGAKAQAARRMEQAGIDVAMMDVIGDRHIQPSSWRLHAGGYPLIPVRAWGP